MTTFVFVIQLSVIVLTVSDNRSILTSFHILLLEHLILCRLVMGQKGQAIKEVATAAQLCSSGSPRLLATHSAQLHTLLGLYSMSMNCLEAAEAQFNCALRVQSDSFLNYVFVKSGCQCFRFGIEYDGSRALDVCQPEPCHSVPAHEA